MLGYVYLHVYSLYTQGLPICIYVAVSTSVVYTYTLTTFGYTVVHVMNYDDDNDDNGNVKEGIHDDAMANDGNELTTMP